MKKTGSLTPETLATSTMEPSSGNGLKRMKQQTIEDLLGECDDNKEDEKTVASINKLTGISTNLASKRVQFNNEVDHHEYVVETPEEEDSSNDYRRHNSDDSIDSDDDASLSDEKQCGSDPEDMESGDFFDYIQKETDRAEDERRFVIHKLKAKTRVGSIFFDKVKRVIAAI